VGDQVRVYRRQQKPVLIVIPLLQMPWSLIPTMPCQDSGPPVLTCYCCLAYVYLQHHVFRFGMVDIMTWFTSIDIFSNRP
jgi:hypothetical protein